MQTARSFQVVRGWGRVWHPPELAEDPDPPPRRPEGRPPNPGSGLPGRPPDSFQWVSP